MKTYRGGRSLDGAVVTVDGQPLALALLADHLADDARALALYEPFMRRVVAELDNSWELTSADIEAALAELKA